MATTTIPWGDGSGDNIYLTYPAASGDQTVVVTSDENTGASRSKVVTFDTGNISRELDVQQTGVYDAQVEYLESTGTQFINLPCTCRANTFFEVSGEVIPVYKNGSKYSIMGASTSPQFTVKFYSINSTTQVITYDSRIGNQTSNGGWGGVAGEKLEFVLSTTTVKSGDTEKTVSRPITSLFNWFRLFGSFADDYRYPIKICRIKIKVGNDTIFDLIPVRVGTTGYMYNKLTGTLYGNAGTGDFTLGPDKQ